MVLDTGGARDGALDHWASVQSTRSSRRVFVWRDSSPITPRRMISMSVDPTRVQVIGRLLIGAAAIAARLWLDALVPRGRARQRARGRAANVRQ